MRRGVGPPGGSGEGARCTWVRLALHWQTGFTALWAKSEGTRSKLKAISGNPALQYPSVTSYPDLKTIKDFTDKDRIAVPAVKISVQAIVLQMAAAQAFGADKRTALDALTV